MVGHAPILSRQDTENMTSEEGNEYMNKLADAAGLREEFEQMQEDMQVRRVCFAIVGYRSQQLDQQTGFFSM